MSNLLDLEKAQEHEASLRQFSALNIANLSSSHEPEQPVKCAKPQLSKSITKPKVAGRKCDQGYTRGVSGRLQTYTQDSPQKPNSKQLPSIQAMVKEALGGGVGE